MKIVRINELPEAGVSHNARIRKRVMIAKGEIPRVMNLSRAVFPPGEKAGSHHHDDMAETFICESGSGEIRVNEVGYVFSAGATVVVQPGESHEIINTGEVDLVVTCFGIVVD